jgi:GntR family transcriptional regulator, transcriptional repressor for pyruvate dehydrogenase complex
MADDHPEPLRTSRMADLVAQRLRESIIRGELEDGADLPREADLIEEFGVSRPSMREALRILETEGIIQIRRGRIGGASVRLPTEKSAAYHLGLVLHSRGVMASDVAAARAVLEPACAGLAAGRKRRTTLTRQLDRLVDQSEALVGKSVEFTATALRFHEAIVEGCGNHTMIVLTGALDAVWSDQERRWAKRATGSGDYPDVERQRGVVAAHRRIVELIRDGDVDGVVRVMRRHLADSQVYVTRGSRKVDVLSSGG